MQQARLDRQENVSDCQVHLPQRQRRNITKVLPHLNLQVLIHLPSRNTAFQHCLFVAVHYDNDYYIGEVVVLSSEEGVVNFMAWCTIKLTAFAWPKLQRCQTDAQCYCIIWTNMVCSGRNSASDEVHTFQCPLCRQLKRLVYMLVLTT